MTINYVLYDTEKFYHVTKAVLTAGFFYGADVLYVSDLVADHGTVRYYAIPDIYTIVQELKYNGAVVLSYNVSDGVSSLPATYTYIRRHILT